MKFFRRRKNQNRFLELLLQQADYAVQGLELLRKYMRDPNPDIAEQVSKIEKEADEVRRILIDDPNYELAPVAESGGTLIVLAERTRGSTRYELWGVAVSTGERRWQRLFEGEE
ncbi:MAG: hypothetical protein ACK4VW_07820, partial [Anaerolineales bacterium]